MKKIKYAKNTGVSGWELRERLKLPLEIKINMSLQRIRQWYEYYKGNVYISFSGGKDSTVLLDLARSIYPNIPAVFSNTGLEWPEIMLFIRETENVTWLKPKLHFTEVIERYGYPVVSKEIAKKIHDLQNPTERNKRTIFLRMGNEISRDGKFHIGMVSKKWLFLKDAPFKISSSCCDVMKKRPFKIYEKKTGRIPIIGTMASEGKFRMSNYLKNGCNAFNSNRPISTPISFWTEEDIWEYLRKFNVPYSKIYDMGYDRTGCVFCCFGTHMEQKKGMNRFQRMYETHPSLWKFCMNKLNLKEVCDYVGIKTKPRKVKY